MRQIILALDAGGTSIKAGTLRAGRVLAQRSFPFGGEGREELLAAFTQAVRWGRGQGAELLGAACPGPFDFAQGVSRMTHKWRGLCGVSLKDALEAAMPGCAPRFLHDSTAFMLGEARHGAAQGWQCPAGVMLGTGFGFALMRGGRVQVDRNATPAMPLWKAPFRDGTVEDYVSTRALRAAYGPQAPTVREIAQRAQGGEARAAEVFARAGAYLGEILERYLPPWVDGVVVGGQIARSAALFLPWTRLRVPVAAAAHIDEAPLLGIEDFCLAPPGALTEEVAPWAP